MKIHTWLLPMVLVSAGMLAACGGDDDEVKPDRPVEGADRIEPLDTALLASPVSGKAAARVTSRWPDGAQMAQVQLPPLVSTKQAGQAKGTALQIGVGREIAATAGFVDFAQALNWHRLDDGVQVAAMTFAAQGAQGLRLGVRAGAWPDGTVLRFYGAPGSAVTEWTADELAARTQLHQEPNPASEDAAIIWGPDSDGPVGTLEVQLSPDADPAQLQLAVPQLSHLWQTPQQAMDGIQKTAQIGRAGSCNIDVMCTNDDAESRSVAKIVFTRGGSSFLCTGTLLNDAQDSQTPYFLTATHCIDNQASASSLITYWFFRSESCGSSPRIDADFVRQTHGAKLLVADRTHDASLLQLNDAPPANVVYAGSYFGDGIRVGTDLLGVHHPSGDLQKASDGRLGGYANCGSDGSCVLSETDHDSMPMFRIDWHRGTTEGGSSGSAIFARMNNARYVVGTLHGGNASCENPDGVDLYGRFERAFSAGLGSWLAGSRS